jgi:hypothetical protein
VDVRLHQCTVLSPAVPPAWREGHNVLGGALGLVLEVVAAYEGRVPLVAFITKKRRNKCIDDCTPTNISQRWTKIATSVMECSDRCYSWSP